MRAHCTMSGAGTIDFRAPFEGADPLAELVVFDEHAARSHYARMLELVKVHRTLRDGEFGWYSSWYDHIRHSVKALGQLLYVVDDADARRAHLVDLSGTVGAFGGAPLEMEHLSRAVGADAAKSERRRQSYMVQDLDALINELASLPTAAQRRARQLANDIAAALYMLLTRRLVALELAKAHSA